MDLSNKTEISDKTGLSDEDCVICLEKIDNRASNYQNCCKTSIHPICYTSCVAKYGNCPC